MYEPHLRSAPYNLRVHTIKIDQSATVSELVTAVTYLKAVLD